MICNRLHGGSVRDCDCRLSPWNRESGGGWLRCPPEARGLLEPIPDDPAPRPSSDALTVPVSMDSGAAMVIERPAAALSIAPGRPAPAMPRLTGEMCPDCGSFAMVRTGTCLTCQMCGGTSGGCS